MSLVSRAPVYPRGGRGVRARVGILGGYTGGYTGWVIREYPAPWKAEPETAKRAPEALGQGWSGWSQVQRPPAVPGTTPAGPGRSLQALPVPGPAPRLLANKGEI